MSTKFVFYLAVFIGSTIGAYIPVLWGADLFSLSSVFFSGVGGILGIVVAWKYFS
jgi:hypothetical protein